MFTVTVYVDNDILKKTYKQQQNVMLSGTGPRMTLSRPYSKIEEKTGQQR